MATNITIQVEANGNATVITVTNPDAISIQVTYTPRVVVDTPSGWDEQVAEYGRGYNYPQPTGQTTVYRTGDDADIEATIFAPIRSANSLKTQNSLATFLTLNHNNSFGNTNRFTDSEGVQDYGSTGTALLDYHIDNYTGFGWYGKELDIIFTTKIWNDAIDGAELYSYGGFSDWFIPNNIQTKSILNNSLTFRQYSDVVTTESNYGFWTSSTEGTSTSNAAYFIYNLGFVNRMAKTSAKQTIVCRKHF